MVKQRAQNTSNIENMGFIQKIVEKIIFDFYNANTGTFCQMFLDFSEKFS